MNRCPNCAAQNRDGAKFCTSCGFKLPATPEPEVAGAPSQRSPFATTSYTPTPTGIDVTVHSDPPDATEEKPDSGSFSTWESATADDAIELPGPGSSWDAGPPQDTAVPVSDEMIETLVGGFPTESWEVEGAPDAEDDQVAQELGSTFEAPANSMSPVASSPNIDHLLRIARELEYGLIELAEAEQQRSPGGEAPGSADSPEFGAVLAGLQSEDELQPLRTAIETARERPRDVDVMLDLVLRAEAIASVIDERDRLKAAIESASGVGSEATDDADESEGADDAGDEELDSAGTPDDEAQSDQYAST